MWKLNGMFLTRRFGVLLTCLRYFRVLALRQSRLRNCGKRFENADHTTNRPVKNIAFLTSAQLQTSEQNQVMWAFSETVPALNLGNLTDAKTSWSVLRRTSSQVVGYVFTDSLARWTLDYKTSRNFWTNREMESSNSTSFWEKRSNAFNTLHYTSSKGNENSFICVCFYKS